MFYPKIGDYVLLRNNKVAKIAQENVAGAVDIFSIELLPDLRSATCSKEFIVKILPQVNLHTLKAGDTVELANGETKEIKSVAYSPSETGVEVVFTTCKTSLPWVYNRNGTMSGFPMNSIVKIIPKPKLDFSMNTVDLTTLKEGDTVHLSNRSTAKVVSVASKMLGTVYVIRLRGFGFNHYCVDGCSLDKDKPSIVRIVDTSTAKERAVPKPKLNLYTLEPGAVVTLANGNTKEVLKVDLQSRAHENHICIKFADGVWIYNPDGTRPPGRDSAYNIVGVTTAAILADIKAHKEFAESVDVTTIKRGDKLTLANGKEVIAGRVTARLAAGETYTVWYENGCPIVDVHINGTALRAESHAWSIVKITPKPKPTPLTIGGYIVKPGDVLSRANGDRIVVDKEITWDKARGGWRVWHSLCYFIVDNSGHCSEMPSLSITAVVPNQTATLHPWPKPITTPPTKKDADFFGQVAVLDKDTDWMKQQWWDARDMLAEGKITGWAHTQAWHDASDPWN